VSEVVFCLTSHNRIDCARINQEIIKLNYRRDYGIVHACSGAQKAAYLEDAFGWFESKPLHSGAINLIQSGIRLSLETFDPKWIVHLEADTWLMDECVITDYLSRLEADPTVVLATSAWMPTRPSRTGRALYDIEDLAWARRRARRLRSIGARSRLDVSDFATQFFIMRTDPRLVDCVLAMRPDERRHAERQFFDTVIEHFPIDAVLRMREREPVHPHNRWSCARLSLHSEHWPALGTAGEDPTRPPGDPVRASPSMPGKREALLRHPDLRKGDALNRLLRATDYDYYNPEAARW
jgi:hypothetical protein